MAQQVAGQALLGLQGAIAEQQMKSAFGNVTGIAKEVQNEASTLAFTCGQACCSAEDFEEEELGTNWLRLCVHHGRSLPHEATFVEVICNKGLRNEQRFASPPASAAYSPTWDFTVEVPGVKFDQLPSVEIRLMKSQLIPFEEGTAQLCLQNVQTVQVEELQLVFSNVLTSCMSCGVHDSHLVVAWQIGTSLDLKADLSRAGSLSKKAMRKQNFTLDAEVKRLKLQHELDGSEEIWLKLFVSTSSSGQEVLVNERAQEDAEAEKQLLVENAVATLSMRENEIQLTHYDLVVQAWDKSDSKQIEQVGEWKESLSELRDIITTRGLKLHFRAQLHLGISVTGEVELVLDIWSAGPHSEPLDLRIPKRKGKSELEKTDKFYLHVGAVGINVSSPYLKVITTEGSSASGAFVKEGDVCGEWRDAFKVVTRPDAPVRLELWGDASETCLLGQATIFEAFASHAACWRHIFGAAEAPVARDEAEEMARRREMPSTHHGSLYVVFDRFGGFLDALMMQMKNAYMMSRYAGRKIRVVVEVPGLDGKASLSFAAQVNSQGLCVFDPPRSATAGSGAFACAEAPVPWAEPGAQPLTWLERSVCLKLPEELSHAFFYIVREGEESYPPEVFGRLQLHYRSSEPVPMWSALHEDRSLARGGGHGKRLGNQEGFMLGLALIEEVSEDAAAEPPKTCTLPLQEVYCHVDLLAARGLPACDEDGLADPCYEVRVEDMVLQLQEPVRRTLNPTFLHRLRLGPLQLPVEMASPGKLSKQQSIGLPPVMITISDKDNTSFNVLGKAALLDLMSLDLQDGELLDVNACHKAAWYALEEDLRLEFSPTPNPAWAFRSRILVAAGFSGLEKVALEMDTPVAETTDGLGRRARIGQVKTEMLMQYNISLDLLGIRGLKDEDEKDILGIKGLTEFKDPKAKDAQVTEIGFIPFWEGAKHSTIWVRLDDWKNCKGQGEDKASAAFWQNLDPWITLEADEGALPNAPSRHSNADWQNNLVIHGNRSCGWRLMLRNYMAPIIPYLQQEFEKKLPQVPLPPKPQGFVSTGDHFVLLPDLVFRLRSSSSNVWGSKDTVDHGMLCVALPLSHSHLPLQLAPHVAKAMRSYRALMGTKMKHKVKEGLTMRTWHWIEAVEHKAAAAVKNTVSNVEHAASNALDKVVHHGSRHGDRHGTHRSPRVSTEATASTPRSESASSHQSVEVPESKDLLELEEGDRVEVLRKDLSGWSYGCLDGHGQREGWFPDWIIREKTNSWVAKYRQDFAELETALQHLPQLPLAEQREEPYDIYVDVFAEATGLLTWDHNFHVDNRLLTPHLFTIKHKEERILQYFNAADWIAGHSHHEQESFDHRFQPSFHCDSAPTDTGRHEMPLGLRRLWRGVMWHNALLERLLRPWKTAQLKQFLWFRGFRLASHQHCPEPVPHRRMADHLHENLHTFVRSLGHKIHPDSDRDSKLLARLRLKAPHPEATCKRRCVDLIDSLGSRWHFFLEPAGTLTATMNGKFVMTLHAHQGITIRQKKGAFCLVLGPATQVQVNELAEMVKLENREMHPQESTSFLVVRFNQAGEVVWAPPAHQLSWAEPGQILFVVKLEASEALVEIRVPSFDLRYPLETNWYPCKTLVGTREFKKHQEDAEASGAMTVVKVEVAPKKKPKAAARKTIQEDGYVHAVHVSKHAFCCRIMKRRNTGHFDRVRSHNWYRSVLSETCTDIATIPSLEFDDTELVKHIFLAKWTNIRRVLSLDDKETGLLKAHVEVEAVEAVESKSLESSMHQSVLPVERLWLQQSFAINIYILTARGVIHDSFREPYVTITLVGSGEEPTKVPALITHDDGRGCDFYHRIGLDLMLPGDGLMLVQLWSKPILGFDQLVGEAYVDLEDRQMALFYRRLRGTCNAEWIRRNLSPLEPTEISHVKHEHHHSLGVRMWEEPKGVVRNHLSGDPTELTQLTFFKPKSRKQPTAYRPHLAPPTPAPIEQLILYKEASMGSNNKTRTGALRMWMDLFTSQERVPEVSFEGFKDIPMPLQVRIKLYEVQNISVFKDFGERNDAYVQGTVTLQSVGKTTIHAELKTDVHKYAQQTASFNELWIIDVDAPMKECKLKLELMDWDSVTGADLIYASKTLALEPLVTAAYWAKVLKRPEPGEVDHQVVFDCFPPDHPGHHEGCGRCCRRFCHCLCFCCRRNCCRPPPTQPNPATLFTSIEVVFREEAWTPPSSEHFMEPKGRVDLKELMVRPDKAMRIMLGPRNLKVVSSAATFCAIFMTLLVVLGVTFLFIHIFIVPLRS